MRKSSVPGNVLKKEELKIYKKMQKLFARLLSKGLGIFLAIRFYLISDHSNTFQYLYKETESTFENKNDTINKKEDSKDKEENSNESNSNILKKIKIRLWMSFWKNQKNSQL